MNIAVILDYFDHFLEYPLSDKDNNYSFLTARKRFTGRNQDIYFCDVLNFKSADKNENKNCNYYFVPAVKLGSIKGDVNLNQLANYYENFFRERYRTLKTNILLTGAATGFERCGLKIAKEMGIKTFCVWEGFFRPDTISIDPEGMNAESQSAGVGMDELKDFIPSEKTLKFLNTYRESLKSGNYTNPDIKKIHGNRFNILKQARKRISEKNDIERIRVNLIQLLYARLRYYADQNKYILPESINKPFIFFPLQTHTDTNLVLNSPFEKQETLIEALVQIFNKNHFQDYILVIKEHPLDVFRKYYSKISSKNVKWIHPAVSGTSLINNNLCKGVIVINSTAGFESLLLNKPVLTCGKSIYAKEGLVIQNKNGDELSSGIEKLLTGKVNEKLVNKFAAYLFEKYQVEGNIEKTPALPEIKKMLTFIS